MVNAHLISFWFRNDSFSPYLPCNIYVFFSFIKSIKIFEFPLQIQSGNFDIPQSFPIPEKVWRKETNISCFKENLYLDSEQHHYRVVGHVCPLRLAGRSAHPPDDRVPQGKSISERKFTFKAVMWLRIRSDYYSFGFRYPDPGV